MSEWQGVLQKVFPFVTKAWWPSWTGHPLAAQITPELDALPARGQLPASVTSWTPLVGKGSLAVLDQGLFAGTNFIVNVLLARWLTPAEYGAFALAYSVFLLLGTFHTASLTEPMMVFGPGKYAPHFHEYLGILLRGHFALMLPGALALAAAAVVLGRLSSPSVERAFLGLALAAPLILLLWLVRRAFYVRLEPGSAALGGGIYLLILLAAVRALRSTRALSPATGFLAMGLGALAVSALLVVRLRPAFALRSVNPTPATVAADHWRYGRWALASAGVAWFPSNIYFVLLPAWFALEAAGALKALMNLAMPPLHSIGALSGILLPVLVRNRQAGGIRSMNRTLRLALAIFLSGSALYVVLLWSFRLQLFQLLYAGKYREYGGWPLLLVGLLPFAASATMVLGCGLRALERPDTIFWCYVGSAVVTVLVGVPLITGIGVAGALLAVLLSSLAAGALMLWFYLRFLRREA